ncbi:HAMP domain-containing sensor histidine kinase [Saccharopolyspora gloriosae]|uniref:histidine kinase n=1 Tax=Saccharopolyspora gloriosae TaxID=455344 RepID=A0A840NF45_9PSEU|nr:two-component system sensor histidine kinase VanS [Saccharopolyspora gloriosae]
MGRPGGLSVRWKLTLSYAGFLLLANALLLVVVWLFLLRYVPEEVRSPAGFVPGRGDLLRAFAPKAAAVLAGVLVFGLVGGWFLAGRMLAPLHRIGGAAELAAAGSLSHRIDLEGPRDEFRELADVFDEMLERIEAHTAEQQRFAANASHELRTPLAISRTLLEVARDDPARDVDELLVRLERVNTRAVELTEALLLLSRADRRSFTREPVDLSLLVEEAVETLLPLAERRGVALDVAGTAAATSGSGPLLLRMATNLVQNAIVHNLPADGLVRMRTEVRAGAAVLDVDNTGDALDPALVARLTEPFQRGAERVRDEEHAGAGLGLAIVRSVVDAHDGTLTLAPRPGGGLRITAALPAADLIGDPGASRRRRR